ncbi:MAG: electron transfer flavoprotein subunit alpha/FixB family protein [Acidimicrobiia bacterium]|nr:electron transfer flavoprotein subunit alpha/FixB family protein [Acidimicrobiia bacterium]NNL27500.1 electron transfer flavoprotein subunit alpha/FixB family protein [Acidimicrobiia bacterium]
MFVLVEHDRGEVEPASLEALTFARTRGDVTAVVVGEGADQAAAGLGGYGASHITIATNELLADYGPDAWADALAQVVGAAGATEVLAAGTDRGNEVIAQLAARLDLPMAANVLELAKPGEVLRLQWGGSLHELAAFEEPMLLYTISPHSIEATGGAGASGTVVEQPIELDESATVTMIKDRVTTAEGITLATAPIVVSGGRGMGSAEAFDMLEELADLVGGKVGCSRVVTNNGWRNHRDQVGQTGTVVAPDVYLACGISGAIQHWVGMMNAKTVIAINTDKDAPMVTKADYAIVADLHDVVPALIEEVKRRRA